MRILFFCLLNNLLFNIIIYNNKLFTKGVSVIYDRIEGR